MAGFSQHMPRIDASRFSMVPRPDIPRSTFITTHTHKTTFDAGYLVPIHVDEVLPGDVHQGEVTIFARLSTPLFPIMDQMWLETFFFFVPNRIVWPNWVKMMGERANPSDSISYTVPQLVSAAGGFPVGSVMDYMGLPTVGQVNGAGIISAISLPLRGYNLIWNEWFRDQNLQNAVITNIDDGPDAPADFALLRRNKQHDYFTSALPWPLKGGTDVTLPGASAINGGQYPVTGLGVAAATAPNATSGSLYETAAAGVGAAVVYPWYWGTISFQVEASGTGTPSGAGTRPQVYADLSTATGATINALRLAVQTQRLLERDARSGTRYTELLRAHFGVLPQDARLQRPEYIGGGQCAIHTSAIPQTSATGITGGTSPLGALGAAATATDTHNFSYHATEHGWIIGLAHVRAELTYQQGLHRMWTRSTRYDYYWPVFAHLGEQPIRNDEIYATGLYSVGTGDLGTFGYAERWAEYRHRPSRITGLFRSTSTGNIDEWHLAQQFTSTPTLNTTFMQDTPPLSRVLAAGVTANGMQILFDSVFKIKNTRPMPMYSVPGMMDRF